MFRIYWSFDGSCYTFEFYLHEFLVVSTKSGNEVAKGGNKKKSGKVSIPSTFMVSYFFCLTFNPIKKPELNLWEEYLESFWISKGTLIRWIDEKIRNNEGNIYHRESLKELRNKIKDKPL